MQQQPIEEFDAEKVSSDSDKKSSDANLVTNGNQNVLMDKKCDRAAPWYETYNIYEQRNVSINLSEKQFEHFSGHIIDGVILFPGIGWLHLVWETFGSMMSISHEKIKVVFEDVKFLRKTLLEKNKDVHAAILIHKASGRFEIVEKKSTIAQGIVKIGDQDELSEISVSPKDDAVMMQKLDFYKEMKLRGYSYHGLFRAVTEIRDDGLEGKIQWNDDWTTFIDSLLQILIFSKDTRMLILPTSIRKLIIDPKLHLELCENLQSEKNFKVATSSCLQTIRAGGVEIQGFGGTMVFKHRPTLVPILETYKFVPNNGSMVLSEIDIAKVCVQLALENEPTRKLVIVGDEDEETFCELVCKGLEDLPNSVDFTILKKSQNFQDVANVNFIIKSSCLNNQEFLETAKTAMNGKGFILSRESSAPVTRDDLVVVASFQSENDEFFCLSRFPEDIEKPENLIKITADFDEWLEPLQKILKDGKTVSFAQNDEVSGILGLVSCIRKEPIGENLRCFFIDDPTAPEFDLNNNFYDNQLNLGLSMNVFKNGQWGTYRHLKLEQKLEMKPQDGHHFVNDLIQGDLSTLAWTQGSLTSTEDVRIHFATVNPRDLMLASGKIKYDDVFHRIEQENVMGCEFSGVTSEGRHVMGLRPTGALSTQCQLEKSLLWDLPENWSLNEAASVPLAYFTVYSAFFVESKIEKEKSILIHDGTGGVGLAAIHVALAYGLEVYATCSTQAEKNFLLERFPQLDEAKIGILRNSSFEEMVKAGTNGQGVDFVLSSLSRDTLEASIRSLAKNGTFLGFGKFDARNKTNLTMGHFAKRVVFKAVFVDNMMSDPKECELVQRLIDTDLKSGIVKPLPTKIFEADRVEEAFRFMANTKDIGKVLFKLRDNPDSLQSLPISSFPRIHCNPNESFILVGGLGGFGLELADWLVLRGCRKLVFSSARGVTNSYQAFRIQLWKSYGVQVIVCTSKTQTPDGCQQLIDQAMELGPVGGIFNMAVVLRDKMFKNQDSTRFRQSFAPKSTATKFLDEISRKCCPELKHFVIFSSVSCGRGNLGQSNYGMTNSIMERTMETRAELALPAKAIQWGVIGDVGLVSDLQEKNSELEICGTLPQSISSCLEVMDFLLTSGETVVASMVVAKKKLDGFEYRG